MESSANDIVKICPKCHASFTCSLIDCWCSKLPHVMPMMPGADCYCPKCLAEIIEHLKR